MLAKIELYPSTLLMWKCQNHNFANFFHSPPTQELFLSKPSVLILKLMSVAALAESSF